MLKSTAGGGGIGMRRVRDAGELARGLRRRRRAWREPTSAGGAATSRSSSTRARHIEVQIFGDGAGEVVALGERDCSLQRRNQKVIEETPAPGPARRDARRRCSMRRCAWARAVRLPVGRHGRVRLRRDARRVLLPRGQHPPAGRARRHRGGHRRRPRRVDGAAGRRRAAAARRMRAAPRRAPRSRSASTPRIRRRDFQPSAGALTRRGASPTDARVETWVERGTEVTPYYDPMLAKIIVHGGDRDEALRAPARRARPRRRIDGIETNLDYLRQVARARRRSCAAACTHALLESVRLRAATHRRARRRHADHRAGLPGPPRLLGRRRAAVRSDGRRCRSGSPTAWSAIPARRARRWSSR